MGSGPASAPGVSTKGELVRSATPTDFRNGLVARFRDADAAKLTEYLESEDTTLAIAAAWEKARRTIAPGESADAAYPATALARFAGFVEGALHVQPPTHWEEGLSSAVYRNRTFTGFAAPHAPSKEPGFDREKRAWIVTAGKREFRIPANQFDSDGSHTYSITLSDDGEFAFVAMYTMTPSKFPVFRIDVESGRIQWRREIWGGVWLGAGSGPCPQHVDLLIRDKSVYVFGVGILSLFIEELDVSTGDVETRFGTGYMDWVSPRRA